MSVNVTIYADEPPRIEDNQVVLDDTTRLRIPGGTYTDRASWCRTFAFLLLGQATRYDADAETARVHLAQAREQLAQIRRQVGQIADDGWCWKCKVDDHTEHATYDEGICAGCACPERPAQAVA